MPIVPATGQEMPAGPPSQASAADVESAMMDEQRAKIEAMAASAPMPKTAYTIARIEGVLKELNKFSEAVAPGQPPIEWIPPEGEKKWSQPLPAPVYVPLMALFEYAKGTGFEKYAMAPQDLADDAGLRKAAGQVGRMAKDKKLINTFAGGPEKADEVPPAAAGPRELDTTDEELMGAM